MKSVMIDLGEIERIEGVISEQQSYYGFMVTDNAVGTLSVATSSLSCFRRSLSYKCVTST